MTPILKTARLTLSPPFVHEGMNLDHYLRWLCNETVTKYSEHRHKPHTPESQYAYLKAFEGDDQIWEIQRNATPIGTVTAYRNIPNRTANLGIMIGEQKVWGQGYGPEAWEAVCNYLFEDGIRKIEAGCMVSNRAMTSILLKCGFEQEAILPNYFLLNGQPEDMGYYGRYNQQKIIALKKEKALA